LYVSKKELITARNRQLDQQYDKEVEAQNLQLQLAAEDKEMNRIKDIRFFGRIGGT